MDDETGAQDLVGLRLLDRNGASVGRVGQVFFDDQTDAPTWLTVRTGLFSGRENFVPLRGVRRISEGVQVPYGQSTIRTAPRFPIDQHISVEQEDAIYQHYGIVPEAAGAPAAEPEGDESGVWPRVETPSGAAAAHGTSALSSVRTLEVAHSPDGPSGQGGAADSAARSAGDGGREEFAAGTGAAESVRLQEAALQDEDVPGGGVRGVDWGATEPRAPEQPGPESGGARAAQRTGPQIAEPRSAGAAEQQAAGEPAGPGEEPQERPRGRHRKDAAESRYSVDQFG
ncbi:PRC-barrel domain-containing protein [Nocardiopsis coralliicola]